MQGADSFDASLRQTEPSIFTSTCRLARSSLPPSGSTKPDPTTHNSSFSTPFPLSSLKSSATSHSSPQLALLA